MNATSLAWFSIFVVLLGLSLRRATWAIALYFLTFFAMPSWWWWGDGFLAAIGTRWSLISACIVLVAVIIDPRRLFREVPSYCQKIICVFGIYVLNAVCVHMLFADTPEVSWLGLDNLLKNFVLMVLMVLTVRDKTDLKILFFALVLCGSYVGYGVVYDDVGSYQHGRLERVPIPNAAQANETAMLFSIILPLGGGLFFYETRRLRWLLAVTVPFVLEVVLRCNSRGAFLALLAAAVTLLVFTGRQSRKKVLVGFLLAALAVMVLTGAEALQMMVSRFSTTFASVEERDASAQSRVDFWKRGAMFVLDHPIGAGHSAAFESHSGLEYIRDLGENRFRAVHNGYLDITASWGFQGAALYCLAFFMVVTKLIGSIRRARQWLNWRTDLLGCCILGCYVIILVTSIFGSTLDEEWVFWWVSFATGYTRCVDAELGERRDAENDIDDVQVPSECVTL